MRTAFLKLFMPLLLACSFCACGQEEGMSRVPLADPYIMYYNDMYYAYGTNSDNGFGVWTSQDLKVWELAQGNAKDGLVMHKDDVWGDYWFWAPEVHQLNGKFYLCYSAQEHICMAVSDSPLGPFVQERKRPLLPREKCIDNTIFVDDDGKAYMYFDRFNDGLNIWVAEMNDDYLSIKRGTMRKCINVSQAWETKWPRVNEGCFVMKHDGRYYMTYSANSYESQYYGIGYAVSDSPVGPWVKYEGNPILQMPGDLVGTGHSAMFTDKDGDLRIVFHAHKDKENIHPRDMYISSVEFKNGVMSVDEDYMTPLYKAE